MRHFTWNLSLVSLLVGLLVTSGQVGAAIQADAKPKARLEFTLADLGYEFPRYAVPEGETMMSYLRARAMQGARERYRPLHDRARRQIEDSLQWVEEEEMRGKAGREIQGASV